VVRIYPREHGQVRVLLKRVAPRHGFVSTYQNDGCRCADCTAANTEAMLEYRRRITPVIAKAPRKHGAQCWKYGCHCDERKAADRLRQSRHRARLAAAGALLEGDTEEPEPTATPSNVRVLSALENAVATEEIPALTTPSRATRVATTP
jgi:hypothetical protein